MYHPGTPGGDLLYISGDQIMAAEAARVDRQSRRNAIDRIDRNAMGCGFQWQSRGRGHAGGRAGNGQGGPHLRAARKLLRRASPPRALGEITPLAGSGRNSRWKPHFQMVVWIRECMVGDTESILEPQDCFRIARHPDRISRHPNSAFPIGKYFAVPSAPAYPTGGPPSRVVATNSVKLRTHGGLPWGRMRKTPYTRCAITQHGQIPRVTSNMMRFVMALLLRHRSSSSLAPSPVSAR